MKKPQNYLEKQNFFLYLYYFIIVHTIVVHTYRTINILKIKIKKFDILDNVNLSSYIIIILIDTKEQLATILIYEYIFTPLTYRFLFVFL